MPTLTQQQIEELQKRGLSIERINELAQSKGYDLPEGGEKGLKGFATGFTKGALGIARGTAQVAQRFGQGALATLTPYTGEEIRAKTGFKSLDALKPEGKAVEEILEPQGTAEKIGSVTADIATFFMPTSTGTRAAGALTKKAGEKLYKLGVGISAKEAPMIQAYRARYPLAERIAHIVTDQPLTKPITNAESAIRQSLFGTESMIGTQAKRASTKLWKQTIGPALKGVEKKVSMPEFINGIEKEIVKVEDLSRRRQLETAMKAFKEDYGQVGEITYEQLQKYKEGWAKFIPDKAYKGKPIAASFREVQNIASQLARNTIYKELGPEIKAAYFDYGNMLNLQSMGQKALTQSKLKGGFGGFVTGIKDALVTPIATIGGMTLYRAGEGVEFVGRTGLKTVQQVFGL